MQRPLPMTRVEAIKKAQHGRYIAERMQLHRAMLLFLLLHLVTSAQAFSVLPRVSTTRQNNIHIRMSDSDNESEAMEAIRSLIDFHDGTWKGKATSFSITDDVAAGIVKRKTSPEYTTTIKLGLADEGMSMTETFQWQDRISSRTVPLTKSNMDVDSVDASYSLDTSLPDVPSDISGTKTLSQFGIEHCIAVNDDARVRCLAFYGIRGGVLARVVVMHEHRVLNNPLAKRDDLMVMSNDIDRIDDKISGQVVGDDDSNSSATEREERMEKLQKVVLSSTTAAEEEGAALSLHHMSLLELSSGVWLGDSIVRDLPNVAATPYDRGSGFATKTPTMIDSRRDFAKWDVGVQKNAWRWIWKLGESIRQEDEVGNAMGTPMAEELSQSLSGTVCVNESLSRRVPRDERMVYINWENGDYVGFILGSVSIQLPRYITFDSSSTKNVKPFYTEFCVYQSAKSEENDDTGDDVKGSNSDEEDVKLPQLCCSKIARVYNFEGKLKQGCTSFFTLRRL